MKQLINDAHNLLIKKGDRPTVAHENLQKKGDRSPHERYTPGNPTNQHGTAPPTQEGTDTTPQGTDTAHNAPARRTRQNGTPNRDAAPDANNPAHDRDDQKTTTTQPENDREDGRTQANDPPSSAARRTTADADGTRTPEDGATDRTEETGKEEKRTGKTPNDNKPHSPLLITLYFADQD